MTTKKQTNDGAKSKRSRVWLRVAVFIVTFVVTGTVVGVVVHTVVATVTSVTSASINALLSIGAIVAAFGVALTIAATAAKTIGSDPVVWYSHYCHKCEYDLTGNTNGVCPECGTAIPSEQRFPRQ